MKNLSDYDEDQKCVTKREGVSVLTKCNVYVLHAINFIANG